MTIDEIKLEDAKNKFPPHTWKYHYDIEGLTTSLHEVGNERHAKRKSLFIDPLAKEGVFRGKRVLDLGCNSGFWALHAIEAGASYVHGVDARQLFIDQANFVFEAKDISKDKYDFELADFFEVLNRHEYVASFDIVLCLGIFYHIKKPLELLEGISKVNSDLLIIDTTVFKTDEAVISVRPEGDKDILETANDRIVFVSSEKAIHWMAEEVGYDCYTLESQFKNNVSIWDYNAKERLAFVCSKKTDVQSIFPNAKQPYSKAVDSINKLELNRKRK